MRKPKPLPSKHLYRAVLWTDREVILPHLQRCSGCPVRDQVEEMCHKAGWTYDSYFLAAFFDHEGLLTEIGEGA